MAGGASAGRLDVSSAVGDQQRGGCIGGYDANGFYSHRELQLAACVFITAGQSCVRSGRGTVKDMCYEVRRAEACVDSSAHHVLVNARERDIV
jgi:hypothetical protein